MTSHDDNLMVLCNMCRKTRPLGQPCDCKPKPTKTTAPWQNTNMLELEKELKWRQLQNEKRKEIVLNAAVAVLKKLRLTKMGT